MILHIVARIDKLLRFIFVISLAAAGPAFAIPQDEARFLLARTCFAPSDAEVAVLAARPSRASAVAALLTALDFTAANPMNWMTDAKTFPTELAYQNYVASLAAPLSSDPATRTKQLETVQATQMSQFRVWWTEQMRTSATPMAERLILFLHNYFAVTAGDPYLIWHLQKEFRACGGAGLGFACLLDAVVHDPGVLRYLSQTTSTMTQPVANFARELMELFTVGVGNYTEQDVTETARALTGLGIGPDGMALMRPQYHDGGSKTIMGQTGNWGPDDVQRILLHQAGLTTRIVTNLWLEYVSPTPDAAVIAPVAAALTRDPKLQLLPVIATLLNSAAFWAPANHGTLVKSPAEFVIGALRQLGFDLGRMTDTAAAIGATGERLWVPPNVRGFLTGTNWIDTRSLVARQGIAHVIATGWNTEALMPRYGANVPRLTPADYVTWANKVMGDQPMLTPPVAPVLLWEAAERLLRDPAYWLK